MRDELAISLHVTSDSNVASFIEKEELIGMCARAEAHHCVCIIGKTFDEVESALDGTENKRDRYDSEEDCTNCHKSKECFVPYDVRLHCRDSFGGTPSRGRSYYRLKSWLRRQNSFALLREIKTSILHLLTEHLLAHVRIQDLLCCIPSVINLLSDEFALPG
jgi:hypothetical protein